MANQTVVGIFNTVSEAQQAVQQLQSAGFERDYVDMSQATSGSGSGSNYTNSSGTATEGVADAAGRTGDSIGGFFSSLFGDSDEARTYAEVARSGHSVVTVHADSADQAQRAASILDSAGAIDVDSKAAEYGLSNSYTAGRQNQNWTDQGGATSAQVIEENLQVGKRVEQTGGARLRSRIVERPVEANVRLREEHVTVQRTPVNRPATEADFTAFKEGEITLTESAERAVVAKEARVVEEVSLGKEVTEREETIRETVRKTEVDVENLGTTGTARTSGTDMDSDSRRS